jgi:hypothetical protein
MFCHAWDQSRSTLARTTASRHHAVASSIAPAPMAIVPIDVPESFL